MCSLKIGLGNPQAKHQTVHSSLTMFKSCHVLPQIEDTAGDDVLDNLDVDGATEHPDSADLSSVLSDQIAVENTLSEPVTLLQEVENVLQKEEWQEFAEDIPLGEDLQLHEGSVENEEYEVEEDQDNWNDLQEDRAADGEKMECTREEVVMEQEDEDIKMQENLNKKEKQESEEDEEKEEQEMLVEGKKEDKYGEALNAEEEQEDEEENETKTLSCPLEDEEQEIKLDTSDEAESFHESNQSVEDIATESPEVVNQPERCLTPECSEQPSFVVMTSLELSVPKKTSYQLIEMEDVPEIVQKDASEQQDILEEHEDQSTESRLQIAEKHSEEVHQEEVLSETLQSSSSESEHVKESIWEVQLSETDDEPVFSKSPSTDHPSDFMIAEPSASQVEIRSLPSSPLQREMGQADEDTTPENPFGVRLRKTPILHRYASEGESPTPSMEPMETQKSPFLEQLSRKPALAKKSEQVSDGVVKPRRTSGTNCLFSISCTVLNDLTGYQD